MDKKNLLVVVVSVLVIILGTFMLYTSFEARFNVDPLTKKLTVFRNTRHFNISIFGSKLAEYDVLWVARLVEPFYERTAKQFGDLIDKKWFTVYIADDFTDYYSATGEGVLLPTRRVQDRDARFLLIKTAHVLIGTGAWAWQKDHVAAEGIAAYCADRYLQNTFMIDAVLEKKASLYKLDHARYFVWRWPEAEQQYVYAKAGAFIGYLIDAYGLEKVKDLLRSNGRDWEGCFGKSLKALEVEWLSRV